MSLLRTILEHSAPASDASPAFIREIVDIHGVRVVRLQGPVGKEIGQQEHAAEEAAERTEGVFERSVLFDFKETTDWDSSTLAYLVQALRRRMSVRARVGIINPSPQLVAELEIARLQGFFRIFASEDEAIAELSRAGPPH